VKHPIIQSFEASRSFLAASKTRLEGGIKPQPARMSAFADECRCKGVGEGRHSCWLWLYAAF
jgi:hypothetical protein